MWILHLRHYLPLIPHIAWSLNFETCVDETSSNSTSSLGLDLLIKQAAEIRSPHAAIQGPQMARDPLKHGTAGELTKEQERRVSSLVERWNRVLCQWLSDVGWITSPANGEPQCSSAYRDSLQRPTCSQTTREFRLVRFSPPSSLGTNALEDQTSQGFVSLPYR